MSPGHGLQRGCEICVAVPAAGTINNLNLERITKVSPETLLPFVAKILSRGMD